MKRLYFVFLFSIFIGCTESSEVKIYLSISTSSTGDYEYYNIEINGAELVATEKIINYNNDYSSSDQIVSKEQTQLTVKQFNEIIEFREGLNEFSDYHIDESITVLDSWFFSMKVDNFETFTFYYSELYEKESYKDLKKVIELILEVSPININLRGFA